MACQLCGGATTVFSIGKPHEREHCHACGGQRYKGLLVTRSDWDQWVNLQAEHLKGQPVVQQLELITA